jgi:hypothetical protein
MCRANPGPITSSWGRFVGEALAGAAKPVGGDDDGCVKLQDEQRERERDQAVVAQARRGDAIRSGQDDVEDSPAASSLS